MLTSISVWLSPIAEAVTPPLVDDSRLPEPLPPAPPEATEQRQQCLVSTPASPNAQTATAGQLKGLNLPAVWRLSRGAGQTVAVIDTGVCAPSPSAPSRTGG